MFHAIATPPACVTPVGKTADIGNLQQKMLRQRQLALKRTRNAIAMPSVAATQGPGFAERALQKKAADWLGPAVLEMEATGNQTEGAAVKVCAAEPSVVDKVVPEGKGSGQHSKLVWDSSQKASSGPDAGTSISPGEGSSPAVGHDPFRLCDVESDSGTFAIDATVGMLSFGKPDNSSLNAEPCPARPEELGRLGQNPQQKQNLGSWDLHVGDDLAQPAPAKAKEKGGLKLWRPWKRNVATRNVQISEEDVDHICSFDTGMGVGLDPSDDISEPGGRRGGFVEDIRAPTPFPDSIEELEGSFGDAVAPLPGSMF